MLDALARALALRGAPLFAPVSADDLLPIAGLCTEVDVDAGEFLFRAGEPGDALFVVITGTVRVERDGREQARLGPGECVGELAVLDHEPRAADVVAIEGARLIRLERNDLLDLLADRPELLRALARVLARRLRGMVEA